VIPPNDAVMPQVCGGPASPTAAQSPRRRRRLAASVLLASFLLAGCADAQRPAGEGAEAVPIAAPGAGGAEAVAIAAPGAGQVLFIPSAGALCPRLRFHKIARA